MALYRVPIEFEATDDGDARSHAEIMNRHEADEHRAMFRVVLDELQVQDTYWRRVGPPKDGTS